MKEQFRDKTFGNAIKISLGDGRDWEAQTLDIIHRCEQIVNEYLEQDIKLTLRQLYYQMVARGFIPNHDKVYDKLGVLLTDARYNGLIDWEAIEDRVRVPKMHAQWDNVLDLIKSARYSYRLPRWVDQPCYIELFTEKDALSSVLQPIADDWHVHFCVNRGYSSASAMYDLGKRIAKQIEAGKQCVILYLGDHDSSVTGDTPILTRVGGKISLMRMKEVVHLLKDDVLLDVLAMDNDTLNVEFKKAIGYFEHDADRIFHIKYTGGELRCTGSHSIYTVDESGVISTKKVDDLKGDEHLVTFCGTALDVEKNQKLKVPVIKSVKLVPDEITVSLDFMKLVGFYNAEGCIKLQQGVPVAIQFSFDNSEIGYLNETERIMFDVFSLKHIPSAMGIYFSIPAATFFHALYPSHANRKRLPDFIWSCGKDEVASFIDGYVCGDGHIISKEYRNWGSAIISTASKGMADDLVWLMRCRGIPATGRKSVNKDHYKLDGCFIKGGLTYAVTVPASWRRKDANRTARCFQIPNVFRDVKIKRPRCAWNRGLRTDIWKVLNKDNARKLLAKFDVDEQKRKLIASTIGIAKIYKVTMLETNEMVYDITVKDASNFFGGTCPILLHNSGLDMLRDIRERLTEFLTKGSEYVYPAFEVVPIALTMAQVRQYTPPPNLAKLTDPRAKWYISKYGDKSWEVDALRPEIMIKLVNAIIAKYVDMPKLEAVKRKERQDMKSVEDFAKTLLGLDKEMNPPAAYKFDRDDLRTKAMLMKLIHDTECDDVEKGCEPYFHCPICGSAFTAILENIEEIFDHIFDDHTEAEFDELLNEEMK